jgi:hypothetical protein
MACRGRRLSGPLSPFLRAAFEAQKQRRRDFDDVRAAAYHRAAEATRGAMLNPRGLAAGIDAWTLFRCNTTTAIAYASDELVEHWSKHPRLTFASYEKQLYEGPPE